MDSSLYDLDFAAWADNQATELRRLSQTTTSNAIDWSNLIEEVETLGRSHVTGVERKLVLILAHVIKVISAPDSPAVRGWRAEIGSYQRVVRKQYSTSMRQRLDLQSIWSDARDESAAMLLEWGDAPIRSLPAENPFTLDDLIATDFTADGALSQLSSALVQGRPA